MKDETPRFWADAEVWHQGKIGRVNVVVGLLGGERAENIDLVKSMTTSTNPSPFGMPTTNWAMIGSAGIEGEDQRQALTTLILQYSPALRAVLARRFGLRAGEAEELVQGFMVERVLEKEIIARADRKLGKFRTFMLSSLIHYVIDKHRMKKNESALKEQLAPAAPTVSTSDDPRLINDAEWAKCVIHLALERMKRACEESSRMDLWLVFEGRVVAPALEARK